MPLRRRTVLLNLSAPFAAAALSACGGGGESGSDPGPAPSPPPPPPPPSPPPAGSRTYVYVANVGSDDLSGFEIVDAAAGKLSPLAGARVSTQGDEPRAVVADRAGRFLYVANRDTSSIAVFAIDAAGGGEIWRRQIKAPIRAAPTVGG